MTDQYCKLKQSDPYEEITLYITHGFLHLLGFDDIEEAFGFGARGFRELLGYLESGSVF